MSTPAIAVPQLNMALALLQAEGFWMPGRGSTTAGGVDWLFYFILTISAIFFIGIVVVMALFVFRYRARPGHREQQTASHSLPLELTWSLSGSGGPGGQSPGRPGGPGRPRRRKEGEPWYRSGCRCPRNLFG